MAKTSEDYQRELAELFCRSGETQFMVRAFRQGIENENNKLNNINQKIETVQKAYRTFLSNPPSASPQQEETSKEEVNNVSSEDIHD